MNSWSPGALRELVGVFGAAENLPSIFDREFRTSHLWRQCKTRQRRRSEYGKSSFVGIRKGQSKLGANFWTPNLPNVVDGRSPISRRFAAASLRFLQCLTSSKHSKKHSDYFVDSQNRHLVAGHVHSDRKRAASGFITSKRCAEDNACGSHKIVVLRCHNGVDPGRTFVMWSIVTSPLKPSLIELSATC